MVLEHYDDPQQSFTDDPNGAGRGSVVDEHRLPGEEPIKAGPDQGGKDQRKPNEPIAVPAATTGTLNDSRQADAATSLVPAEEAENLRAKWTTIQSTFVDEPRKAVKETDALVAEVVGRVTQLFADERSRLEQQWSRGDDVSTEDLRLAMQRYHSFFDRLLSR